MSDVLLFPCPRCGAQNRVPTGKDARSGKCGRCKAPLFDGHPIALGAARFDRYAGCEDLPLLVDFWASWCGPCRGMAPVFEAAARSYEPRLRFAKVDVDAEKALAERFRVQAIPTLILFRGGREIARHAGAVSASGLRQWLGQNLPA